MRIVILNTWYYPNMMGGAEHSVKILAENLVKKLNQVFIITVDSPENKTIHEKINGVDVYRLNSRKYKLFEAYQKKYSGISLYINKFHELFNNSIKNDFYRVLNEIKPDVAHINCISGLSYVAIECLHKKHIPMVYTLRNYFMLNPTNKSFPSILTNFYTKLVKKYSNYAIAVTAPSNFTLQKHLKAGLFDKVKIKKRIVNCVDIPYQTSLEEIDLHKKRISDTTNFIYAGWLSEDKGIRYLLDAFNHLSNAHLTLCGDGDLKEFVLEEAKKHSNIKFLGKLNEKELFKQYELADVSIVPSIWDEPFGRVVIEANAFGLPVIASNRGGIPEIIYTMQSGIVYEAKDTNELKNKMQQFSYKDKRSFYLDNIKKNIRKYSAVIQADNFLSIYKKVLGLKDKIK